MYAHAETQMPVIIGMWHGQHFLASFLRRHHPGKVLISRHRDGEINAIAAEHLGGRNHARLRRPWPRAPAQGRGRSVPRDGRCVGAGLQHGAHRRRAESIAASPVSASSSSPAPPAGRSSSWPSRPATASRVKNWDRAAINLPFGRGAIVGVGPIYVPADADDAALEAARRLVETELNAATARAYEMVDGPRPRGGPCLIPCHCRCGPTGCCRRRRRRWRPRLLSHRLKRGKEHADAYQRTLRRKPGPRGRPGPWCGSTAPASASCWR